MAKAALPSFFLPKKRQKCTWTLRRRRTLLMLYYFCHFLLELCSHDPLHFSSHHSSSRKNRTHWLINFLFFQIELYWKCVEGNRFLSILHCVHFFTLANKTVLYQIAPNSRKIHTKFEKNLSIPELDFQGNQAVCLFSEGLKLQPLHADVFSLQPFFKVKGRAFLF